LVIDLLGAFNAKISFISRLSIFKLKMQDKQWRAQFQDLPLKIKLSQLFKGSESGEVLEI
jgi:hypothetical protein